MKAKELILNDNDVEWIVNDLCELGVKISDQFFFMYKGHSYKGGSKWRKIFKREFGECCCPWDFLEKNGIKSLPEDYSKTFPEYEDEWHDLPESFRED